MGRSGSTGKLIGAVLGLTLGTLLFRNSLAGMLGLLLGGYLGHTYDKRYTETLQREGRALGGLDDTARDRERVYFKSLFLALGHLARAEGRVTDAEISVARGFMHRAQLRPEEQQTAIELFNRGKDPAFNIEGQLERLAGAYRGQQEALDFFIATLIRLRLESRGLGRAEHAMLRRMARVLGIGTVDFAALEAQLLAQAGFGRAAAAAGAANELEQAYKALGVDATAADDEVKTAYRRLMNKHHPDKLAARGLPDSMMEAAKEKTREIRAAYERIREHRGTF